MGTFSAMDVARTGVGFAHHWIETTAHNVANLQTVNGPGEEPFRARLLVAESLGAELAPTGSGVRVAAIVEDESDPARVYDPGNALADEEGYVTMPVVELSGQMSNLMLAQRSYQLNLKVIESAREAYQASLRLGQR